VAQRQLGTRTYSRVLPWDRALGSEFRLCTLIVAQMGSHQALPQLAMIRHIKVQQLMDDHLVRQLAIKREQVVAEVQIVPINARLCRPVGAL